MVANRFGLQTYSSRLMLDGEWVRVLIAPDYYQLDWTDFEIACLELDYPRKFHTLSHSQVLGSLLHQLGMKRHYLGDIFVGENRVWVCMDQTFAELVQREVDRVARVPVKWLVCSSQDIQVDKGATGEKKDVLVSSLRLDKLVAVAFQLSRSQASRLIEAGQVKVEHSETKQVDKLLVLNQLVSVRGYGRVRLLEERGYSRQGRLKLTIDIIRR